MAKCKVCGDFISWEKQRKQFGAAMKLGIRKDTWKKDGPLCPGDFDTYVKLNGLDEDPAVAQRAHWEQREMDRQFRAALELKD